MEARNTYNVFDRKTEEKRPLVRHNCGWEINIKVDHKETCQCMDRVDLAQVKNQRRSS
jgi:hypothetical protein